ncbi:hypothetical protein [Labilibaculum euxinus]
MSSCENENQDVSVKSAPNLLSEAEINDIGVRHNEVLDYVFKNMSSQEEFNTKNSIDIENIIKNGLNEYCATIFTGDELDNAIKYSNKEVSSYLGKKKMKSASTTEIEQASSMLSVIKENREQLSKAQIKYLLRFESVFLSDNVDDINTLIEKLDVIEESVKNELTTEEAQIVLIYLSVGRNSISYWNENFNNWENKLSGSKTKGWWDDVWRATKQIAMADAMTAAGTAITCFALNVVVGPGTVAYGSSIVLAAGGASAFEAYTVAKSYDCEYIMNAPMTISSVLKDDRSLCMVNVKDFSKIESYSVDNIDLTNVSLYVDGDLYFRVAHGLEENQDVYLYAFCPENYYGTGMPLSVHIDEIEDKSMEIKRILVGSTTYDNLNVKRQEEPFFN